jgi:tripartite-type tricarboxylate transporter receptor subunit TctC
LRTLKTGFMLVLLAAALNANAQSWPTKSVRLITTGSPGQSIDIMLRLIADKLSRSLNRSVYVENMPGGAGRIAGQAAARAAPDGYSFYLGGLGFMITDRYMMKDIPYDPDKDFVPVAKVYDTGAFAVAVHPSLPAKNIPELIAYAKANPGKISYGSESVGATAIAAQWFLKAAGIEVVIVPYKIATQLAQNLVSGQIQAAVTSVPVVETYHRSSKARILGITTPRRLDTLPDVPTVGETLPGFRVGGLGILMAPAGTPADIVQKMNREVDAVVRDKDYRERLASFGFSVSDAGTPQSIPEFVRTERENWDKIMKGLNIKPQ